jgi:hypothetical protein
MEQTLLNKMTLVQHSPASPHRVLQLADGSFTNPKGTVVFIGKSSKAKAGQRYEIVDIYCGVDTGNRFIGISIDSSIYRFIESEFKEGKLFTPDPLEDYWTRGGDYHSKGLKSL